MEAIASCYWAAIALDAKSTLSTAEAVDCLAEFLRANRGRLLKVKGNGAITNVSYRGSVGLIPDPDRHGKRVWLKSKVLQTSVFQPGAFFHAVEKLKKFGAIVPASNGSMCSSSACRFLASKSTSMLSTRKSFARPIETATGRGCGHSLMGCQSSYLLTPLSYSPASRRPELVRSWCAGSMATE